MKSVRFFTLLTHFALPLLVAVAPLSAQEPVRSLVVDRAVSDSLAPDAVHAYMLELPAGQFVYGLADQHTMDVVITVMGPDGEEVGHFDFSARGRDPFQFDTETAGRYRIEISPFERQTGRYSLVLERVEPVATRPAERVDQLMAEYSGAGVPGGVIGVVRDGQLVFSRGYGSANLTHDVAFAVETPTNLGSTSKQFAAFAILLLADRGELSLDDDVREHIPELPDFGPTVTLRHLLTHTSGYREFLNTLGLTGRRLDRGDYIERDEIIAMVQRQPELQNEPGAEWNYNNTGYALLAVVVERVSGATFPEWLEANVFGPLLMEHTTVRATRSQIIPGAAQGYGPAEDGGWREVADIAGAMGPGGIYTTVGDMAKWMANFGTHRLGSPETFERMTTRYVLSTGDTTHYGLGLSIDEYRGLGRVQHGGADAAHRAMMTYFPEIDAGVVAFSNNASFDAGTIADQVADVFFDEHLEPKEQDEGSLAAAAADGPFEMDADAFEDLAGSYAMSEMPAFVVRFFREDGVFFTQATGQDRFEIVPTSDSTFTLPRIEAAVTFHRGADGRADSITVHQNGDHVARRVDGPGDQWSPSAQELAAYTGRYFSTELETFYDVAIADSSLVIRQRRFDEEVALTPAAERDVFSAGFPVGKVDFLRGDDGGIVGFTVANGRTRGVRFDRIED